MAITNWALAASGASATADSEYPGWPVANLIDGSSGTAWACNGTGLASWARVDLGQARLVQLVWLHQYSGYGATRWKVQYSTNDSDWVDAGTFDTPGGNDSGWLLLPTPITARYWKVLPLVLQYATQFDVWTFGLGQDTTTPEVYLTAIVGEVASDVTPGALLTAIVGEVASDATPGAQMSAIVGEVMHLVMPPSVLLTAIVGEVMWRMDPVTPVRKRAFAVMVG